MTPVLVLLQESADGLDERNGGARPVEASCAGLGAKG